MLRFVVMATTALGAAGCAQHAPVSMQTLQPSPQAAGCELLPTPSVMAESLWVVVTEVVRAAPIRAASTNAEHVVSPLLYSVQTTANCAAASGAVPATTAPRPAGSIEPGESSAPPRAIDSPSATAAGWRPTTGRYRIGEATDTSLDLIPRARLGGPLVHVSMIDARRGRDVLDAGADVLVTSDPTTIAYAAAQANLSSVPLSWDRVYVLIEPGPPSRGESYSALAVKADLAADALRAEARPVTDSAYRDLITCPSLLTPYSGSGTPPPRSKIARIVYHKGDEVARALSERLVALADANAPRLAALETTVNSAGSVRAAGLDSAAFQEALADGREAAYVAILPADLGERCVAVDWFRLHAEWLRADPVAGHITPLIETRSRAIVRNQRVGLSIDGAGNVYLDFGPRPRP